MIGDEGRLRQLLSDGRDPNQKMGVWYDSEPLGWAASFGLIRSIIVLILHGADPLRPANKAGNTPLKDAERERYVKTASFLRE